MARLVGDQAGHSRWQGWSGSNGPEQRHEALLFTVFAEAKSAFNSVQFVEVLVSLRSGCFRND
jgi:hypothetical protein